MSLARIARNHEAALAPRTLTGRGFRRATMPRKTTKPAPPVILTAEQIEAKARRDAAADAYVAAREDLLSRAQTIAERLHPGRVFLHSMAPYGWRTEPRLAGFSVMFGANDAPRLSFAGPGVVEMCVELTMWSRASGSDNFDPPALRFLPRAYSLSCSDGIDGAEAQGRALIEAAAFARTLTALLALLA